MVQRIAFELIEDGAVTHAFLGVSGATHYVESDDGSRAPAGVLVDEVIADTAAEDAGVAAGDVIVSVNGKALITTEELVLRIRLHRVGETVSIVVDRSGERLTFEISLGERPEGV
jgi:serine protease Do